VVVDVTPAWLGLYWLPSLGVLTLVLLLSVLMLGGLALLITPALQLEQEPEPEPEPEIESECALALPPDVLMSLCSIAALRLAHRRRLIGTPATLGDAVARCALPRRCL
jgi:hypothetical protein